MPTTNLLEEFFFEAMTKGYAVGAEAKREIALPGSKTFKYTRGDLMLMDVWYTTQGTPFSDGSTRIYYNGIIEWWKSYEGWYTKDAIPFLQEALADAYENKVFFGGRGRKVFKPKGSDLVYANHPSSNSTFARFEGSEGITTVEGVGLGGHRYRGGLYRR